MNYLLIASERCLHARDFNEARDVTANLNGPGRQTCIALACALRLSRSLKSIWSNSGPYSLLACSYERCIWSKDL